MQSNSLYKVRLAENDVDSAVKRIIQPFKDKGLPLFLTLGPSSTPEGLSACLKKNGLSCVQKQKSMALDLNSIEDNLSIPRGLTIREVKNKDDLKHFFNIFTIGFYYSRSLAEFICETYGDTLLNSVNSGIHYLALAQDVPVATASLFTTDKIAGLYNIITTPQARHQGIGKIMTLIPLLKGKELGCETAILHATEAGARVYSKLGFKEYCDLQLYMKLNGGSKLSFPASYINRSVRNKLLAKQRIAIG